MSHLTLRSAIIGASISLMLTTSPAEAAKGIKNGTQNTGTHTFSGIVKKVIPDKTGYGVIELKTAYNHKKSLYSNSGVSSNGTSGNHQVRKLNVTSATRFEHHMGGMANLVNASALQPGQRVTVQFTGQHADQVHIYTPMHTNGRRMGGSFNRHRSSAYYPHLHHHRARGF